jgi:uncharacterized protein YecT (DUF1311 family)
LARSSRVAAQSAPSWARDSSFFFHEQKKWLRERERKAAGAVQSKGGSLAALEYNGAFADLTKKRIAEFHRCPRREREFDFVVL